MNSLLRSLLPQLHKQIEQQTTELKTKENEPLPPLECPMLIQWITIRAIGKRDRAQQEIMHLLLQEKMCHSNFVYVNLHLDKYDVRTLKP